ncbi:MAG: hypothetical protein P1V81_02745 [Planctomycetota bacterium]|nr:hypothetical protein [Planctomycetota bacterium]
MSHPREGTGAWLPVLTFVLVFAGAVVGSMLWGQGGEIVRDQVDLAPDDVLEVSGWAGPEDPFAAGLVLRLTPLHAEPERQAFDAGALAARLGLEAGQPWRLEVTWPLGAGVKPRFEKLFAALTEAPTSLTIVDDQGLCASTFARLVTEAHGRHLVQLFDPERTLEVSAERAEGQLHFWGRGPGEGARLAGPGFSLPMAPVEVLRGDLPTFVANLDEVDR